MYRIRPATITDLQLVYDMQNVEFREMVFIEPLAPRETFLPQTEKNIGDGKEFYYIFEENGRPDGFIQYDICQTTSIWGKWLNTLIFCCAKLAFDDLKFNKLTWYSRASNKRMIRACDKFHFRRIGERSVCNITEGFGFVAVGKIYYYELTSQEFHDNESWMSKLGHPVEIEFQNEN